MATLAQIEELSEKLCGLPKGALRSTSLTRDVSLGRHIYCYLARKETKLAFKVISLGIGLKDHKSAIYGFNRISIGMCTGDVEILTAIMKAREALKGL